MLLRPPTKPGVELSLGYLGAFFLPLSINRKRKKNFIEAQVLVLFKAYPLCHVLKRGDVSCVIQSRNQSFYLLKKISLVVTAQLVRE